jgi:hypothetical protein
MIGYGNADGHPDGRPSALTEAEKFPVETFTVGCGVSQHSDDCLCDVVITEPVRVRYSPTDIVGSMYAARQLGVGWPWTPEDFGWVMTHVMQAWDQVNDQQPTGEFSWEARRRLSCYHQAGGDILGALTDLGMTFADWKAALLTNRKVRVVDGRHSLSPLYGLQLTDWLTLESEFRNRRIDLWSDCRRFIGDVDFRAVARVAKILGWEANEARPRTNYPEGVLELRDRLLLAGVAPAEVVRQVEGETGVKLPGTTTRSRRARMLKQGLIR